MVYQGKRPFKPKNETGDSKPRNEETESRGRPSSIPVKARDSSVPDRIGECIPLRKVVTYRVNYSAYARLLAAVYANLRLHLRAGQLLDFTLIDFYIYGFDLLKTRLQTIAVKLKRFRGIERKYTTVFVFEPIAMFLNGLGDIEAYGFNYVPDYNEFIRYEINNYCARLVADGTEQAYLRVPGAMVRQGEQSGPRTFSTMTDYLLDFSNDRLYQGGDMNAFAMALVGTAIGKEIPTAGVGLPALVNALGAVNLRLDNNNNITGVTLRRNDQGVNRFCDGLNQRFFDTQKYPQAMTFFDYGEIADQIVARAGFYGVLEMLRAKARGREIVPEYSTGHYSTLSHVSYEKGAHAVVSPLKLSAHDVGVAYMNCAMSPLDSIYLKSGYVLSATTETYESIVPGAIAASLNANK